MPESPPGRRAYYTYRGLATALQFVPGPLASLAARTAGLTLSELWRDRRPVVRANLRRVLGPGASEEEVERAVGSAFDSYARYWVESARLVHMRPSWIYRHFSIEGFEPVREALVAKRGAILTLPHLGSWEVGGYWLTLQGHPMTTVAEPVQPPELFEWLTSQRTALGLEILALAPGSIGRLVETLRQGRLVGLVADRDLSGTGVEVDFFGEPTRLPGGPALLALRTGAPLFPAAVYQERRGRFRGVVRPALSFERSGRLRDDVVSVTALLAKEFEALISRAPAQWHMFQPNWPSDPGYGASANPAR